MNCDELRIGSIEPVWSSDDGRVAEVHFLPDAAAKTIYIVDNKTGEILEELPWHD